MCIRDSPYSHTTTNSGTLRPLAAVHASVLPKPHKHHATCSCSPLRRRQKLRSTVMGCMKIHTCAYTLAGVTGYFIDWQLDTCWEYVRIQGSTCTFCYGSRSWVSRDGEIGWEKKGLVPQLWLSYKEINHHHPIRWWVKVKKFYTYRRQIGIKTTQYSLG